MRMSSFFFFFFSSRRRHTRSLRDWSSDVCSSDLRSAAGRGCRSRKASGTPTGEYRRRGRVGAMGLADVANILWREREALDLLLFKLEEEQLVLATGRTRWLAHATREVEFVLDRIRQTELLRAVEVDAAAAELGLPPSPSLRARADAAPPPWGDVLRDHRRAFLALT